MYPAAPSTPLDFVSIFKFLLNSFGFIDGKKKTFYLPFFFSLMKYIEKVHCPACQVWHWALRLCVSGVVQEPQGPQEAAGLRVKGQAAVACPQPDLQHRPVAAAQPVPPGGRRSAARSLPHHPGGSPTFATAADLRPSGNDWESCRLLWRINAFLVGILYCLQLQSFICKCWAFIHTQPLEQKLCSVVLPELWVEECTQDS